MSNDLIKKKICVATVLIIKFNFNQICILLLACEFKISLTFVDYNAILNVYLVYYSHAAYTSIDKNEKKKRKEKTTFFFDHLIYNY